MTKSNTLQSILKSKPLIIGIGNELRSDDGAGIVITKKLLNMGYPRALPVFDTPENYLQKIATMDGESRLWIDVINWDSVPGNYKIFLPEEIHHFAISTHNYSPTVLLEYLKPFRSIPDFFLGIQPATLNLGDSISPAVQDAIADILKIASKILI
jgi:hydrogenase 3 maturation protease